MSKLVGLLCFKSISVFEAYLYLIFLGIKRRFSGESLEEISKECTTLLLGNYVKHLKPRTWKSLDWAARLSSLRSVLRVSLQPLNNLQNRMIPCIKECVFKTVELPKCRPNMSRTSKDYEILFRITPLNQRTPQIRPNYSPLNISGKSYFLQGKTHIYCLLI